MKILLILIFLVCSVTSYSAPNNTSGPTSVGQDVFRSINKTVQQTSSNMDEVVGLRIEAVQKVHHGKSHELYFLEPFIKGSGEFLNYDLRVRLNYEDSGFH